ncbi:MAG: T9SS type A sorting domain-containing protein [Ferruginibacter sp.]
MRNLVKHIVPAMQLHFVTKNCNSTPIKSSLPSLKVLFIVAFLALVNVSFGQKTWNGASGGNWGTGSNWNPTGVPTSSDDVIIPNDDDVVVNVAAAACKTLTINGGNRDNTITISGTNTLTVSGAVTINAPTSNNRDKIIAVGGGTLTCTSITMSATGAASRTAQVTLAGGTVNVTGNISMSTNNYFTCTGAGTLNLGGNMTGGTFAAGTGTVNCNGATAQVFGSTSPTAFYNFTVNKTAAANTVTSNGSAFTVSNNLTVTQGNLTLAATDNDYSISNNLTVASNGTLTHNVSWDTYGKLISVAGNIDIAGTFTYSNRSHIQMTGNNKTISTGTSAIGILTLLTGNISANGTVTINDNFWATFGSTGSFHTNGQTVNANGALLNSGGTLYIDGGTLNVSGGLYIGYASSNGSVNFSSGTLNADFVNVGDGTRTGTVAQSGGTANISGALTINGSCSYTCSNSPAINLGGNFTNNGTFTAATGTVTTNGSSALSIGGTTATTFYNLTNTNTNATGVSLGNNITVSNNLTLSSASNGKITTGSYKLILTKTTPLTAITGASSTKYIAGNLQFAYPAGTTTSLVYPIGTTSVYAPVTISVTGAASSLNILASTTTGTPTNENNPVTNSSGINQSQKAGNYWTLTNISGTLTNYTATFDFSNTTNTGTTSSYTLRNYSSAWATSGTVTLPTSTTIRGASLTTFGEFEAGVANPAPSVSANPSNSSICPAANTSFTSTATASPAATVQWQRNAGSGYVNITSANQDGTATYGGYTSTTLSITAATASMTGYLYRAVFTNINGSGTSSGATLTIYTLPSASISYTGSPYCITGGTATVTRSGQTGGTYSSTAGLSINSSTGDITLASTTPGTYTVTYSFTNGTCSNSTTTNVTVNSVVNKTVAAAASAVCYGTGTNITVASSQTGVDYQLRNNADNSLIGSVVTGNGGTISLPTGNLTSATTFNVLGTVSAGCSAQMSATATVTINALPTPSISANYCIGAGLVRLTSTSATSYLWSTDETTQYIDVDMAGAYSVTVTNAAGCSNSATYNLATEMVTNGNFSAGNTGFSTGYSYTTTNLYPEGYYAVGPNANTYHSNFFGTEKKKPGTGNFMVVNGSPTTQNVWQQTLTVTPNTTYYFSAYAMSVNNGSPFAQLQFSINGVQVGSTANLVSGASSTAGPFTWVRFYGQWNSGASTSAILNILDLQTAAGGNDFGIDDISFSTLSPGATSAAPTGNGGSPLCSGNTLNLLANVTNGTYPLTYAWTGPNSFTSSLQNPSIANATTAATGTYYLTVTDTYGCTTNANTAVTVNQTPSMTSASSKTICTGSSVALSLTSDVSSNYSWIAASNGNVGGESTTSQSGSTINNTLTNATSGSENVVYTVTPTSTTGSCAGSPQTVTITVIPASAGGTAASAQTICSGSSPADLTLTGNTGSVVKWQYSTDNFVSSINDIASSASTTLTSAQMGTLTANRYFRAQVQSSPCAVAYSNTILVTVSQASVGGTASSAQTICSGSSPVNLTLAGNTGSVVKWQYSTDNFVSSINDIASSASTTLTSASMGSLTGNRYYRAQVQNSPCAVAYSNTILITVNPASAGGTASSDQTICSGSSPANLTLSGNTGSVVKWQYSTNNFSTSTDISSSASTTLTSAQMGTLTGNRYYRAQVQNSPCAVAYSNIILITVSAASAGGTASSAQTICSGSSPANLTLASNTGGVVKWQYSTDNFVSDINDIASSASTTLTSALMGTLTANRYFRAQVQNSPCAVAYSNAVLITVNASVGGTASSDQTICSGSSPANLTLSGYAGSIVRWQYSTDNFVSSTNNIAASASATLTSAQMGTLSGDRYYRAQVQNGSCTVAYSNTIFIDVSPASVGGTASSAQTICSGSSPADLTLASNTGNVVKWQYSTDNFVSSINDIASSASTTLTSAQMGTLSGNRYFRAQVQSSPCAVAYSNAVLITVSQASAGGTASSAQTICSGSSPANLTLASNTGSVVKWQYSTDNFVSDINDIASSASTTLTSALMGTLTANRYYRAQVQNSPCAVAYSNAVLITVNTSVGGTASSAQTICSGSSPANLTLASNTGSVVKWQYSTDNFVSSINDIASSASTTLTSAQMGTLTGNRYYRAQVQNGSCTVAYSSVVLITVSTASAGGTASSAQTICSGSSPANITLASNNGSVVKWQYSTDNFVSDINDIASSASTTLTSALMGTLTANRYYRAQVQNSPCAVAYSNAVLITVNTSVGGTASSAQTICSGSSPTNLTLASNTGSVVKWQYSTDNFVSSINDISSSASTTLTSAQMGTLTANRYYRAQVQNGSCTVAYSSVVLITVSSASAGGTASSAQTICSGNSPANLTLASNTGSVVKWQYSTDNFVSDINDIASSASTTLTSALMGTLTANRYFRAQVQNSPCAVAYSNAVLITVNTSVGGTASSAQTICSGSSPANLTLASNTGSVVKWQYSTDNFVSSINDIASSASTTLTSAQMGTLTANRYFRAQVQNGSCTVAYSSVVLITVSTASAGGTASSAQTICSGNSPANLTLASNNGSVVKWQYSTDNFVSDINDIASSASTTLTSALMGTLTANRYYRAQVQNSPCAVAYSNAVLITVNTSVGGTASSAQTICSGSSPANLTLASNTGSVVKWQYSTDNFVSSINDISSSASTTLTSAQMGTLTANRYFRAQVQNGSCTVAYSSVVLITVSTASAGGTASSAQTICSGSSPANITLASNNGSVVKWQYSTDNFVSDINDIASSASTTLTSALMGTLTANRYYRAQVQNSPCAVAYSNAVLITVNTSVGGTASSAQTICSGSSPANLTLASNTGSVVRWQYSTDNFVSSINNIGSSASTTLTSALMGTLTANRYFRAQVQNGSCTVAYSSVVLITVSSASAGGTASSAQTICSGSSPANITLASNNGSVVKWQYSTDNFVSDINDIASSASTTLTSALMGTLTANRYFRAQVQNSPCAVAYSNAILITVNTSVGGTASSVQTICSGNSPANLTLASNTGSVVKWQYSTDNFVSSTNDISSSASTTLTSALMGTLTANRYFRAVVQNGSCATANSNAVLVTVNPGGQWIGGTSGDWNNASNWCGGIPTTGTNVIIPAGVTVNIQSANAVANSVTIAGTASLVMTGAYNLGITSGGSFSNNGTFNASSSTGTVSFAGNGTVSGTTTFKNIDTYGALDFGTASTINGTFSLQTGGSVTGHSPTYTCPSSTLLYKPGSTYTRGLEWTNSSSGAGYPANVLVQNNTTINFPAAGDGYVCYDLQIDNGSSLLQNYSGGSSSLHIGRNVTITGTLELGTNTGGDIYVGGSWTRNSSGVFNANNRMVIFEGPSNFSGNGTSMSTISAPASSAKDNEGGFGGETFAHIWINKSSTADSVVLLSNITVNREIGFTRGTFSLGNNDVTIVSNSSRTADVAPITNTANVDIRYGGTGKFVVQRFIHNPTGTRAWRLLTAPLQSTGAPSINEAWQEGVTNPDKTTPNGSGGIYNPWPGYGTHITGPGGTYDSTNGFDQGTNSASILYANSSGWISPASNITTKVTDQQGWMLFVRGDRSFVIGSQYVASQNTILEPKGRINTGNVSVHANSGKIVMGNPYASSISLLNIDVAGTAGKNSSYYQWDPKMYTSYTQPGKWVAFTGVGNSFVQTSSESSYASDGTIESGQAFVLDVPTAGNIIFHESDKKALSSSLIGISSGVAARPGSNQYGLFRSDILAGNEGKFTLTDGVLNIFNSSYDNKANAADAKKLISFNTKESLSILRDSVKMAIEKRMDVQSADTIFFTMARFNELPYQFRFNASGFATGMQAWLEDSYTGKRTTLSTAGITTVDFNITADAASKAENRFRVVFKNSINYSLPVTFTNVKAWPQNNNVAVQWNVENELNIEQYEIEKSSDGQHFTKAGSTTATQSNTYNWLDETAAAGNNYYRIVSREASGKLLYSQVVKVNMGSIAGNINVYPNPVTNGVIKLKFTNMEKGTYNVKLLNALGQTVIATTINHAGGNNTKELDTPEKLTRGIYHLEISNNNTSAKVIKVMVE